MAEPDIISTFQVFDRTIGIVEEERPDIGLFFQHFGNGFAGAVAGPRLDPDDDRIFAVVRFLQLGCKLEGVRRYYAVVVVAGRDR